MNLSSSYLCCNPCLEVCISMPSSPQIFTCLCSCGFRYSAMSHVTNPLSSLNISLYSQRPCCISEENSGPDFAASSLFCFSMLFHPTNDSYRPAPDSAGWESVFPLVTRLRHSLSTWVLSSSTSVPWLMFPVAPYQLQRHRKT